MQRRDRKFSIMDGMIVVAAAAVAVAWTRSEVEETLRLQVGTPPGVRLLFWVPIPIALLVSATLAVLVMRSRRPRPRWRQLVYQPGAAACSGIALVAALQAVLIAIALGLNRIPGVSFKNPAMGTQLPWTIINSACDSGLTVIGIWLTLACARRWRPEASWIDRAGRAIGFCWIALYLVQRTVVYMMGDA